MKIYAIRDEAAAVPKDLAYLLYYETEKLFYIELPEDADPWETPLLLDAFVKKGEQTVNSYWSLLWVQQRIIPPDRQNLGQILREHGLKEYDEYSLLMLAMGRCAQDDYYLSPITEQELPASILARASKRIEDVLPLEDHGLLVFFADGSVKRCQMGDYFQKHKRFQILLRQPEAFANLRLMTGGFGIAWDLDLTVSDRTLYRIGKKIPLTMGDFKSFVRQRVVTVAEAVELLDCSRQNIKDLTDRSKLHPVKASEKSTLYLKSEVLKRKWQ